MEPATQQIVDSIPRFVIPEGAITTASNSPAAPEKPAATPEASPAKAAPEPAASEPATPPAEAKTEVEKPTEEKPESGKATTEKDPESDDKVRPASRSYERRIDRATKRAALAEARAEAAEREAAEIKAKIAPPPDPNEPKAEQFTDLEEYAKAKADFAVKKAESAREAKAKEETQKQEQTRLTEAWEEVADKGQSKYPDFHEKVGDLKPTTPWAVAIMETDNGHDVAMHLANHPKEAERIIGLHPRQQFLEIGKLSAKLASAPAPVRTPSKAPAPIQPESGAATVPDTDPYKPQPFEQYLKTRPKSFSGANRY
jgi:hypothetical protein